VTSKTPTAMTRCRWAASGVAASWATKWRQPKRRGRTPSASEGRASCHPPSHAASPRIASPAPPCRHRRPPQRHGTPTAQGGACWHASTVAAGAAQCCPRWRHHGQHRGKRLANGYRVDLGATYSSFWHFTTGVWLLSVMQPSPRVAEVPLASHDTTRRRADRDSRPRPC
jgi:hypothetical protein